MMIVQSPLLLLLCFFGTQICIVQASDTNYLRTLRKECSNGEEILFETLIQVKAVGNPWCSPSDKLHVGKEISKTFDEAMKNVQTPRVQVQHSNTRFCKVSSVTGTYITSTSRISTTQATSPVQSPVQSPTTENDPNVPGNDVMSTNSLNTHFRHFHRGGNLRFLVGNHDDKVRESMLFEYNQYEKETKVLGRSLSSWGEFIYRGTGRCRLCYSDNDDERRHRRKLRAHASASGSARNGYAYSYSFSNSDGTIETSSTTAGNDYRYHTMAGIVNGENTRGEFKFATTRAGEDIMSLLSKTMSEYLTHQVGGRFHQTEGHCFFRRRPTVTVKIERISRPRELRCPGDF